MGKYDKLFISLKYYLLGRKYFTALKALDFAKRHHKGMRKDGVTPELQHQVEIALFLTTLKDLQDEQLTLTCALLHDVVEDYDISVEEITSLFGKEVADHVWILSKEYRGEKVPPEQYFPAIGRNPIASLVKGADRINNVQSMHGVFTVDKQRAYVSEVKTYFLPMLKEAKYLFPEQSAAYFNIMHMLKSQVELVEAALELPADQVVDTPHLVPLTRGPKGCLAAYVVRAHETHYCHLDAGHPTDNHECKCGCESKWSRVLDENPYNSLCPACKKPATSSCRCPGFTEHPGHGYGCINGHTWKK